MKTKIVFTVFFLVFCYHSIAQKNQDGFIEDTIINPVRDSSVSVIYCYLNWFNATNYEYHFQINDTLLLNMKNHTRLVILIKSSGPIVLSDKGHKPFLTLNTRPGNRYYIRIRKYGAGRYFTLQKMMTSEEKMDFMIHGFNTSFLEFGTFVWNYGKDVGDTYIISEPDDKPFIGQ